MAATRTQPVRVTGLAIAVGVALFGWLAFATPVEAHGKGSSPQCSNGIEVGGNQDVVTFTAPAGQVITGVCIKSGANMFGGAGHSGVLTNANSDSCYTINIAADGSSVTVTRIGDGPSCQGISHLDVVTAAAGSGGTPPGGGGTPPTGGGTGGTGGAGAGTGGGTAGGGAGNQGSPRGAVLGSQGGPGGGTLPNTAVAAGELATSLGTALLALSGVTGILARRIVR